MKTIKDIIAEFPGEVLYENKIREKIRVFIGLCGLDENLFRKNNKFQFPDESVPFFVQLIKEYTSDDIRELRKELGLVWGGQDDKIESLFHGFSACLKGLQLDEKVLHRQIHIMDVKLLYSYRKSRGKLYEVLDDLKSNSNSFAKTYYRNHLLYEDLILLTDYIVTSLNELNRNIGYIFSYIDETRSESLYEGAGETAEEISNKILEIDYEDSLVWKKLNENENYKELMEQMREMLNDIRERKHLLRDLGVFKKNYKAKMAEINRIRRETEKEVLGHELKKVDFTANLKFDNPIDVLAAAVQNAAEYSLSQTAIKSRHPLPQDEVNEIIEIAEKVTGKKTPSISPLYLENKK